jgi:hypothetical protein
MNRHRLFVTSCISIGTAALVFAIRGDVAGPMSAAFHITNEQMGLVFSPAFFAFTLAILISGNLIDVVGMRALHALSAIGFIAGVALVTLAPHPAGPVASLFAHPGTTMLFIGFFLFGLSHGLVEGVINPLLATIYSAEKTKKLRLVARRPDHRRTAWAAMTSSSRCPRRSLCSSRLPRSHLLIAAAAVPAERARRRTSDRPDVEGDDAAGLPAVVYLHVGNGRGRDGAGSMVPARGDPRAAAESRRRERRAFWYTPPA